MENTPDRFGPYRIGGHALDDRDDLFTASDERLGKEVLIWNLAPRSDVALEARKQLLLEQKAARRVSHPALVQVSDFGFSDEGTWAILEPAAKGQSLRSALESGPLETDQILKLSADIARGLEALHGHGLIHRDLKPENILLTTEGHAKIMDLGLSGALGSSVDLLDISADPEGWVFPAYSAPENIEFGRPTTSSDVFSLGVIIYEMATGLAPFRDRTFAEAHDRSPRARPVAASKQNPSIPEALSQLIDCLVEIEPRRRPSAMQTARWLEEIARSGGGEPDQQGAVLPDFAGSDNETDAYESSRAESRPAAIGSLGLLLTDRTTALGQDGMSSFYLIVFAAAGHLALASTEVSPASIAVGNTVVAIVGMWVSSLFARLRSIAGIASADRNPTTAEPTNSHQGKWPDV